MPSAAEVKVESIQGEAPVFGNQPSAIRVIVRTSPDCQSVLITVRATDATSPVIGTGTVQVNVQSDSIVDPAVPLPGLAQFQINLPSQIPFQCGDQIYAEVKCAASSDPDFDVNNLSPSSIDSGTFSIQCKDQSDVINPPPPPNRCLFTAAGAAYILLAGLESLAIGIGIQSPVLITAGTALLAAFAVAWALWMYWCEPSRCLQLGVLCYIFKMALLGAIPVIAFATNAMIVLVIVGYGSAAGMLVTELRKRGCQIPSARQPLTQLPI